jgi:hypothetical protein
MAYKTLAELAVQRLLVSNSTGCVRRMRPDSDMTLLFHPTKSQYTYVHQERINNSNEARSSLCWKLECWRKSIILGAGKSILAYRDNFKVDLLDRAAAMRPSNDDRSGIIVMFRVKSKGGISPRYKWP